MTSDTGEVVRELTRLRVEKGQVMGVRVAEEGRNQ